MAVTASITDRLTVTTHGAEQTEALGAIIAAALPKATVVGLIGPLGAGKTCFARGLATGFGVDPSTVASPTFVYLVDYRATDGRILNHADLYRLGGPTAQAPEAQMEALEGIGLYEAMASDSVTIVEWWEYYRGPTPQRRIRVEFAIENVDDRSITLEFAGAGLEEAARLARGYASRSTDT